VIRGVARQSQRRKQLGVFVSQSRRDQGTGSDVGRCKAKSWGEVIENGHNAE